MAQVISVIQEKGGTGKSTIATNLAGMAATQVKKTTKPILGRTPPFPIYKVAIIDCDMPQGTSQSWASIRLENNRQRAANIVATDNQDFQNIWEQPDNLTAWTATNYTELVELVGKLDKDHDLIVIDAPPRIAETTKAALILSTLTLIPLGASAAEIWATADLLNTIEAAKQVKGEVDARILWNRFRASTNSAKELSEAVRTELNLKQLKTRLGYRVAYSEALARGLTALEWTDKQAQAEIKQLGAELNQILKTQLWS